MTTKTIRDTDGKVYEVTTKYDPDTGAPDNKWVEIDSPEVMTNQIAELTAKRDALSTILAEDVPKATIEYETLIAIKVDPVAEEGI